MAVVLVPLAASVVDFCFGVRDLSAGQLLAYISDELHELTSRVVTQACSTNIAHCSSLRLWELWELALLSLLCLTSTSLLLPLHPKLKDRAQSSQSPLPRSRIALRL